MIYLNGSRLSSFRRRTYTLLHTNRVYDELAYHARLLEIEREAAFDERIDPSKTIILACGNPASMTDIQRTAARVGVTFEKEEW